MPSPDVGHPPSPYLRRRLRLICVASLSLAFLVWTAGPAAAHATLLFATPTIGGAVPEAPGQLSLTFDEPVTLGPSPVHLTDSTQGVLRLGTVSRTNAGQVVSVRVLQTLPVGLYTVSWQVVSGDGDIVGGTYRFVVGPPIAGVNSGAPVPAVPVGPVVVSAALRWALFLTLALGLGGLVGAGILWWRKGNQQELPSPTAPVGRAAVVGLLAVVGLMVQLEGDGDFARAVTAPTLRVLWTSSPGRLLLVEAAGFAIAGLLAGLDRRPWAAVPLVGVGLAEGLRAHANVAEPGWGAALTSVHLLAAAVWVGALVYVVRAARSWRPWPGRARGLVRDYARLAIWLFFIVVATGTVTGLLLVPLPALFSTSYGRTLVVKIVLVGGVVTLAWFARRHLMRARKTMGQSVPVGRTVRVERAGLVAVLGVTAVLVSLPPPRVLGSLPIAPPPVGLAVPIGERAGQIGVSAVASTGQLVVQLNAPVLQSTDSGDPNVYALTATVPDSGGSTRQLPSTACGTGCFVLPVSWHDGSNPITLKVASTGWSGGLVTLPVPWPQRAGDALLTRTVNAMRKVPSFTLYEKVTSDTASGLGGVSGFPLSGQAFLATEPYGNGRATYAAASGQGDGLILAVGFPSESTQAQLTLDAQGRIARETLTAPNHLVIRTFVYPE